MDTGIGNAGGGPDDGWAAGTPATAAGPRPQDDVLIHRLTPDDSALLDAAVRDFRGVAVEDHSAFLDDPTATAFVARRGHEVVGWVWGLRQRHVCGYTQVQLYEIGVAEHVRRCGVGRALLAAFRDLAAEEGHRRMWLFTDEDNAAAKALYEAAGGEPSPHDDATYWWQLRPDIG